MNWVIFLNKSLISTFTSAANNHIYKNSNTFSKKNESPCVIVASHLYTFPICNDW